MRFLRIALLALSLEAGIDAFIPRAGTTNFRSATRILNSPDEDFEKRQRRREKLAQDVQAAEAERERILLEIEAVAEKSNESQIEIDEIDTSPGLKKKNQKSKQMGPAEEKQKLEKNLAKIEKKKEKLLQSLKTFQSKEKVIGGGPNELFTPAAATIAGLSVGAVAYGRSKLEQRKIKVEEQESTEEVS